MNRKRLVIQFICLLFRNQLEYYAPVKVTASGSLMSATSLRIKVEPQFSWIMYSVERYSRRSGSSDAFRRTLCAPSKMSKNVALSAQSVIQQQQISIINSIIILTRIIENELKLTSGSQNPIGGDERTAAKVLVIDEQSDLPKFEM